MKIKHLWCQSSGLYNHITAWDSRCRQYWHTGNLNIYNNKIVYHWIYAPPMNMYQKSKIHKNSKRKSKKYCHHISIWKISTTSNHQNGCVFWLNSFPHKERIMMGHKITYNEHCKVEFGTYIQVHEKHNNSMEPRMSGAIALIPSGN